MTAMVNIAFESVWEAPQGAKRKKEKIRKDKERKEKEKKKTRRGEKGEDR